MKMHISNAIKLFNALQSDWHALDALKRSGLIYFRDGRWRPTSGGIAAGLHAHVNLSHL
jgi:hypothetical protein